MNVLQIIKGNLPEVIYMISGEVKIPEVRASAAPATAARSPGSDRVAVLEREVLELRAEIRDIKAEIATLRSQS